jgi:hypothetical protein
MIIEEHLPLPDKLLLEITAEPAIKHVMQWLRSPGRPIPETEAEVDLVIGTLNQRLVPWVEEALGFYLKHHMKQTIGFVPEAVKRQLIPGPELKEFLRDATEAHLINGPELQELLIEAQDPVLDMRRPITQQLAIALLHKLDTWAAHGWVAHGGKLKNEVFQALLGPGLDGARDARRCGAITGGLIHKFVCEALRFPFSNDVYVGYVECPKGAKPEVLVLTPGAQSPVCPTCGQPLDLSSHRILGRRKNVVGTVRSAPGLQGPFPKLPGGQPGWLAIRLYVCPSPQSIRECLGRVANLAALKHPAGVNVFSVLLGVDPPQVGNENTYFRSVGRELEQLRGDFQKRIQAYLDPEEDRKLDHMLDRKFSERLDRLIARQIIIQHIELRAGLARELHFVPRSSATAPHYCSPLLHKANERADAARPSLRPTEVLFRLEGFPPARKPEEPETSSAAEPQKQSVHIVTVAADGTMPSRDRLVALVASHVDRLLNESWTPQARLVLDAMGLKDPDDEQCLKIASDNALELLTLLNASCKSSRCFYDFAAAKLDQMWEVAMSRSGKRLGWMNMQGFIATTLELLETLKGYILSEGNNGL